VLEALSQTTSTTSVSYETPPTSLHRTNNNHHNESPRYRLCHFPGRRLCQRRGGTSPYARRGIDPALLPNPWSRVLQMPPQLLSPSQSPKPPQMQGESNISVVPQDKAVTKPSGLPRPSQRPLLRHMPSLKPSPNQVSKLPLRLQTLSLPMLNVQC
jgi:hypothetical protein